MNYSNFVYIGILLACFAFPLVFSVIHRNVLKREGFLIFNPSILIAAIPFLIWDFWAVNTGRWWFNEDLTLGMKIGNLPIEEIMFFVLIPQSCLLLWVGIKKYQRMGDFWGDVYKHKWLTRLRLITSAWRLARLRLITSAWRLARLRLITSAWRERKND